MSNAVCFGRVLTLNCACTGKRNGSSRKVVRSMTRQSGQLPFALNAKFIFLLDKAHRNSSQGWSFANTLTFAHALVIYRTLPMRACVLTQKSEEAPASSASLLATPMIIPTLIAYFLACHPFINLHFYFHVFILFWC